MAIAKNAPLEPLFGMATAPRKSVTDTMSPDAIGDRLRLIREAYGLSKAEIADLLEIERSHWSRFEGGQRAIPYDKASRLVDRFGISLDFIILGRISGMEFDTVERLRRAGLSA
ncbi:MULTISPECIES: helix-turn-helix domain-containing protein [unclassified Phaeobacter]|uniref:helix-turn-helix domain-containing protein n=1 Tax=unclassified Phaeobacter TaxID=2621772 RepID=UPI003A84E0BC